MKVKVAEGCTLVLEEKEYRFGDQLELEGEMLEVQLNAGVVEEVKVRKSKKGSK